MVIITGKHHNAIVLPIRGNNGNYAIYKRNDHKSSYVLDDFDEPSTIEDTIEYSSEYSDILNSVILKEKRQLIKDIFEGNYEP